MPVESQPFLATSPLASGGLHQGTDAAVMVRVAAAPARSLASRGLL